MSTLVRYSVEAESVAVVTMDDGKRNALSVAMLAELDAALTQADADGAVVVLTGRTEAFSAGFDLPTLKGGGAEAARMLRMGFELTERLLTFPTPVVIACPGHALAMGALVLLSADFRIGADGPYKIGTTEVALGMTMPWSALELARYRLDHTHYNRSMNNAEVYTPAAAVGAGFLDSVVQAEDLTAAAMTKAEELTGLVMTAHHATKLRSREPWLTALRAAMEADDAHRRTFYGLD